MKFKLVEDSSGTGAWMVRNDGTKIPVKAHIYGDDSPLRDGEVDDVSELVDTLDASMWLYNNSTNTGTKDICLNFIVAWIDFNVIPKSNETRVKDTLNSNARGHIFLYDTSKKLLTQLSSVISSEPDFNGDEDDIINLAKKVVQKLNNEFLRVRFGGKYDTTSRTKNNLYFRVSSQGFDWFPIISNIVFEVHPLTITICKDEESTGNENVYTYQGQPVYEMPFNDFLYISDRYVVEKLEIK